MKVSEIRSHYRDQTERASTVARQLALGGIAVIWIFRNTGETLALPRFLYLPTLAFIFSLGADMAQYGIASWRWYTQARLVDRLEATDEHKVPRSTNADAQRLHATKLVAAGIGGLLLACFLGWGALTSRPMISADIKKCECSCRSR